MGYQLDHLAIVVPDTEAALTLWRDRLGYPVLFSEVVNNGATRLTHLDLGNTQLQLVEPLTADNPLHAWLAANGPGLHHLCLAVPDVAGAADELAQRGLPPATPHPLQGTRGRRSLFLDAGATDGIRVELTGQ